MASLQLGFIMQRKLTQHITNIIFFFFFFRNAKERLLTKKFLYTLQRFFFPPVRCEDVCNALDLFPYSHFWVRNNCRRKHFVGGKGTLITIALEFPFPVAIYTKEFEELTH